MDQNDQNMQALIYDMQMQAIAEAMKKQNDERLLTPVVGSFRRQAEHFEKILKVYGYRFQGEEIKSGVSRYFKHATIQDLDCQIYLADISDKNEQSYSFGFAMSKDKTKGFSLRHYYDMHPEHRNILSFFSDKDNLEVVTTCFFAELEQAFATYLNEQISGQKFEDHYAAIQKQHRQVIQKPFWKRLLKALLWPY